MARTIYLGSAPTAAAAHRGLEDRPGEARVCDARRVTGRVRRCAATAGRRGYLSLSGRSALLVLDAADGDQTRRGPRRAAEARSGQGGAGAGRAAACDLRKTGDFSRIHPCRTQGRTCPTISTRDSSCWGSNTRTARSRGVPPRLRRQTILESRGNTPRLYRNTLVFLAADKTRLQDLDEAMRKYLAWESILAEKEALNLDPHQVAGRDAEARRGRHRDGATARDVPVAAGPEQTTPQSAVEWEAIRLSGQDALAVRASKKLRSDELLVTALPPRVRMEWRRIPLWRGGSCEPYPSSSRTSPATSTYLDFRLPWYYSARW